MLFKVVQKTTFHSKLNGVIVPLIKRRCKREEERTTRSIFSRFFGLFAASHQLDNNSATTTLHSSLLVFDNIPPPPLTSLKKKVLILIYCFVRVCFYV
jgi:hypothetical protein